MGMEGSVRRLSIIHVTTKTLLIVCSLVVYLPSGSWSPGVFYLWRCDYKHKKNCLQVK